MTLDPVVLDDLTWNDFNAAALQRIPAASGGLWTLNAPVDPGITLLDLFGWLLEQRVYWMDQVSDPLTRALLKLMGITPNPAVAATTVLHVKPHCNTGETPNAVVLKQGSLVQLSGSLNPPAFTTGEEVTLYPLAQATTSGRFRAPAVTLKVGNLDRSVDLAQGRAPALLDPNGHDTTIVISFSPLAPAPVAGTLSLFFELLTPPGLESGWFPNAPTKPLGPNALTWLATINGTLTPLDSTQVVDGTLGLRRSGIVQLPIPALWTAEPNTTPNPTSVGYAIVLRGSAAGWTVPPRVSRLIPNVVSAVHSRPATGLTQEYIKSQVANWRRLPGNVIVLPEEERPALASTLKVSITGPGQKTATDWTQVDDLGTAGPDDLVYVLDAASAKIRFGNGVTGRLPIPNDPSAVNVSYSVGGGVAGNLASSLPWTVTTGGSATLKAWNVVPSTGGQDAETLEAVRQRAPEVLKSIGRAITIADFEEVATQVPGTTVARAVAAVGRHPDFPNQVVPGAVTVFLVPDVPRKSDGSPDYGTDTLFPAGPVADAPTIAAVLDALNSARMITSEVFVAPANYRQVAISLKVSATPSDPKAMTTALNQALQTYFDPLVGGDEGSGWPFGGPVRPSSLLRIAQGAVGAAGTVNSVTITLDNNTSNAQGCTDVAIGPSDLVVLTQQVQVAYHRPPAGQGGLR
ncbi:MAG TPA: putative baseplate assembly protein [Isosphaeraceae bacterium]|nr:putative baseplate assembly protein [Isosphaeraceae bacterium]